MKQKMKTAIFNATCPFEIGDKIWETKIIGTEAPLTGLEIREKVHTITDIACIHYLRSGNVEFRYELDHSGHYVPIGAQDPPAKERPTSAAAEVGQTKPVPTATTNGLPPEFERFIKKRFG